MRRARHLVFPLALAALALAWMQAVQRFLGPEAVDVPAKPAAIVWSDRVFANPAEMKRWLRSRGASYRAWAASHPAAASILEGRSEVFRPLDQRPAQRSTVPPRSKGPPGRVSAGQRESRTDVDAGGWRRSAFLLFVVTIATILALGASLPASVARLGAETTPGLVLTLAVNHRLQLFAGALALALGVLLGSL